MDYEKSKKLSMMQTDLKMIAQKHLDNPFNIAHLFKMWRKLCFPNSMIFRKNVKIVIWIPEGYRGAPGDPTESSVGPSMLEKPTKKAWKMGTTQ